ncbi:PREDICTED: uncharacterized protein LOC108371478 isoform X2 [Rhagoletis zephyria]|uniref:uncharacterized protein LOC108371478 isoform X2 n=1 Tax=Rhagoletis zephyria TaxID=28612 RepID=UPI0008115031|nr:PREDICTED: uncharacterized protein LOC108371478 isoform X2 [Rhagoletis zephyria]
MDGLQDQKFNIRLVQAIEKYPALYNSDLKTYKRRDCREQAWIEVAEEMDCNPKVLLRKWQNFRTILVRKLKQKQMGEYVQQYYLYEHMKFIIPYLKKSYEPDAIKRTIKKKVDEEEDADINDTDSHQSTEDSAIIPENDIDDPVYFEEEEEYEMSPPRKVKKSDSFEEEPESIGIDEYIDAINHQSETKSNNLGGNALVKPESTTTSRPSTSAAATQFVARPLRHEQHADAEI